MNAHLTLFKIGTEKGILRSISSKYKQLTSGGLFMKGRALLFSALKAVEDFATWAGAKAAAEPARRERAVIFIMVSVY